VKELAEEDQEVLAATPIDASLVVATTEVPEMWGSSTGVGTKQRDMIRKARGLMAVTHGMYAGVPMICKGNMCPFYDTCWIPDADLAIGDRCPIEIATIMEQYDNYCTELSIDVSNKVDQGLVKQLIDIEIMMLRADSKMATSPDLVRQVVDAVNQKTGDVYYKTEIDPVLDLKSDLRKEHHRILTNLQATRKDKKDTLLGKQDPSSMAAKLVQRYQEIKRGQQQVVVMDGEVVEVVEVEEEVSQ
jgi:hypothetical protein